MAERKGALLITVIQAGGGGREGLRHGVCRSRQPAMDGDAKWPRALAGGWMPGLCVEMRQTTSVCTDSLSFHFNAATETPSLAASQDTALEARE